MMQATQQAELSFLVPLDGSRLAESVLPAVQYLAGGKNVTVILLHVLEQNAPSTIHGDRHLTAITEAHAYLEEVATRLRKAGVIVESHVHEDKEQNVARSIGAHAQELNIDLVIMCAHGRGGLRGFLFGSIAQQALQHGTQSILLIHPTEMGEAPPFELDRILVPLDGTAVHEPALPAAQQLARAFNAAIHLVLVIPNLSNLSGEQAVSGSLLPLTMRAVLDLAQQGAADYLAGVLEECRREQITATAEVLRGDPVPTVLGLAERLHIDLIVMASHGKAGLDALLSGSVAPRITERFNRPLLLVRAGTG